MLAIFTLFSASIKGQPVMGAASIDEYIPQLAGKRVAVCANPTSVVGGVHLVDTLVALKVNVVTIFCPEHGFRGEAEAGATIRSSVDEKTGIPIISLYGKNKKPTPEQMKGVDAVVFDIQDVGCRFYTYISTLTYVMEAAAENGVSVIVLDRPNPNGYFVDGPVLDMKFKSFVGMHPVPVVHGMTIGEYAQMVNGEHWLAGGVTCNLKVVKMRNYTHSMRYSLPVAPSPNLQTDESIYLYPSLCLFEGTCVSVGRGTQMPFQVYGHPSMRVGDFHFTPHPIKGVCESPLQNGLDCRGFDLSDYARRMMDSSNQFTLRYLLTAFENIPQDQTFFRNPDFFDKLAGSSKLREQIQNHLSEEYIRASWQPQLNAFKQIRRKYLLYPDFE